MELTKKIAKTQTTIDDLNNISDTLNKTDDELRSEFKSKFHKRAFIAYK